jgi:hypothetical protein
MEVDSMKDNSIFERIGADKYISMRDGSTSPDPTPAPYADLLRRLDQTVIAGTGWGMPRIDGVSLDVVVGEAAAAIRSLEAENARLTQSHIFRDGIRDKELNELHEFNLKLRQRAERAEADVKALREALREQPAA